MYKFNYESCEIEFDDGNIINLSNQETELFNILYNNKGKVMSIEELNKMLYGDEGKINTTKILIFRLRQRLDGKIKIRTVYSKGYILK